MSETPVIDAKGIIFKSKLNRNADGIRYIVNIKIEDWEEIKKTAIAHVIVKIGQRMKSNKGDKRLRLPTADETAAKGLKIFTFDHNGNTVITLAEKLALMNTYEKWESDVEFFRKNIDDMVARKNPQSAIDVMRNTLAQLLAAEPEKPTEPTNSELNSDTNNSDEEEEEENDNNPEEITEEFIAEQPEEERNEWRKLMTEQNVAKKLAAEKEIEDKKAAAKAKRDAAKANRSTVK